MVRTAKWASPLFLGSSSLPTSGVGQSHSASAAVMSDIYAAPCEALPMDWQRQRRSIGLSFVGLSNTA